MKNMSSAKFRFKVMICLLLSVMLMVGGFLPSLGEFSVAEASDATDTIDTKDATDTNDTKDTIASLLSVQESVDGEAIVIMREDETPPEGIRAQSSDILSAAEVLMRVDGSTYDDMIENQTQQTQNSPDAAGAASALEPLSDRTQDVAIVYIKDTGLSTEALLSALMEDPRVLSAEPNYVRNVSPQTDTSIHTADVIDAADIADLTAYQWGTDNTTETAKTETKAEGFDINAPSWNSTQHNATGVIAVLDTGIDYNHPDLDDVMQDMSSYSSVGGRYGYNALVGADPTDPMDDHSHGTHCAGIIAAEWNDFGVSGVANGCTLVAVKIGDAQGMIANAAVIRGYEYLAEAVEKGLDLRAINNSWGSPMTGQAVSLSVDKLGVLGAISLFASGNDATDCDMFSSGWNTLYKSPYSVIVNSAASSATVSSFSNVGMSTTNIFSPGSEILSTYPLSLAQYKPEAIDAQQAQAQNLIYEKYQGPTFAVGVYSDSQSDVELGMQSGSYYYNSGDTYSWEIEPSALIDETVAGIEAKRMSLRFDNMESVKDQIAHLSINIYISGQKNIQSLLSVPVIIEGEEESLLVYLPRSSDGNWLMAATSLKQVLDANEAELIFQEDGSLDLTLVIAVPPAGFGVDDRIYIDAVGIGTKDSCVPYAYASGTSMATPAVSGAAAVLAVRDDPSKSAAEQAQLRAARIMGSIGNEEVYTKEFSELCTSGGALDLSVDETDYTPVLSSAILSENQGRYTIAVKGHFFGTIEGAVSLGGLAAPVLNWSDTEIIVECPTGLPIGPSLVAVTNSPGKTAQKAFYFEPAGTDETGQTPLFEQHYDLPSVEDGFITDMMNGVMYGLGGKLYLLPSDAQAENNAVETMYRLEPRTGEWERCSDLPIALISVSATTYEGKLLVTGSAFEGDTFLQYILTYDPASDQWEQYASEDICLYSTIANCKETLLFVGGLEEDETGQQIASERIVSFDTKSKHVEEIGKLAKGIINPSVAVHIDILFVTDRGSVDDPGSYTLQVITYDGNSCTTVDRTDLISPLLSSKPDSIGIASIKAGMILTGANAQAVTDDENSEFGMQDATFEDEDTYVLYVADQTLGSAFQGFGKRVSYERMLFSLNAVAYDGRYYALGFSTVEKTGFILRATTVETLLQPGDIVDPGPDPVPVPVPANNPDSQSGTLSKAGDTLSLMSWAAAVPMLLAGIALIIARRRLKQERP